MFEHRNYFASLGLCLVCADLCLRAPRIRRVRLAGVVSAMALLMLYTGTTALRAREWDDQLRFSLSESTKHPQSPRATYDVARNFIILSGYRPGSPYINHAFSALDQAMHVPNATILPEAAAIILASRTGRTLQPAWWSGLHHKLSSRSIGPQETAALASLVDCQLHLHCRLPPQEMVDSFVAGLNRGPNAEMLSIYGNYALNALGDPTLALRLWQEAAQRNPKEVQYQQALAKMLIASGQFDQAAVRIAKVRQLGRLGQNEAMALELEQLATQARRDSSRP
jgi:tetratricopeptide (TPR) repeat protein